MNRIVAEKTYYEIQALLGEGLTSQVYKAFRVDGSKYTSQPVALKVVKSRKHIQILRKEFEKLQKVDSKNCVKVYGWESLRSGPALVLELLEGVTLEELSRFTSLTPKMIDEITAQVQNGLADIHQRGLIHGDLNLKNIFITQAGVVKLLDFGVLHNIDGFFGTPSFVAPEIWQQKKYNKYSDLFSLGLVRESLGRNKLKINPTTQNWLQYLKPYFGKNSLLMENSEKRAFLNLKHFKSSKDNLSDLVFCCLKGRESLQQTVLVKNQKKQKIKVNKLVSILLMSLILTMVPYIKKSQAQAALEIRTNKWLKVSINGLPTEYAPLVKKKLRSGKYKLWWMDGKHFKAKEIQLHPNQKIVLKPESINL